MTMLFIQALLWLLITFLLGYWIGRFLKSLFCRDQAEVDVYPPHVTVPKVDGGMADIHSSGISTKTASALGGAAAVAAGAAAVARNRPDEAELPEVSVKAPSIDLSGIDPHKLIVDPPDLDADLPKLDVSLETPKLELPEVDVKAPTIDLSGIDPHKLIVDPPDLDLPDAHITVPDAKMESGVDLWDMVKGAAVAAGTGLTAKVASAIDFDKIDPHKPIVDPPDLDVDLPEVGVKAPSIDLSGIDPHKPIVDPPDLDVDLPKVDVNLEAPKLDLPEVGVKAPTIDLSGIDPHKLIVDPPDLDVDLLEVDVSLGTPKLELPEVDVKAPTIDLSGIDPHKLIVDPPDLDLPDAHITVPDAKMESGVDLWDMVKGAAVAAGAGLTAKVASAIDFDKIDPHKPIVDPPDLDVDLPEVGVKAPTIDLSGIDPHKLIVDPPDLDVDLPKVDLNLETSKLDLPEVGVKAPTIDLSGIDPHKPIVDPPDLDVDLPKVDVNLESPKLELPEVDVKAPTVDLSGIDPHKLIVDPPDLDVNLPEVDVNLAAPKLELPEVGVKAPSIDLSGIDPHKPIVDQPDLDVDLSTEPLSSAPNAKVESGANLWNMIKGAAVAAGAGLTAKIASAIDFDKIDPHKPIVDPPDLDLSEAVPASVGRSSDRDDSGVSAALDTDDEDSVEGAGINWLFVLVQRIKDEYQGHNPRAVSKLWSAGSNAYDCSALEEYESLTLHPAQYDKLGIIHCGVPHAGFVAVGGDVSSIAQGEAVFFHYPGIVVCRDDGDRHYFVRVTG